MNLQRTARFVLRTGPSALQPISIQNAGLTVCLGLCLFVSGNAQNLPFSVPGAAVVPVEKQMPVPLALHYDDPITFPVGSTQSIVFGDFKCGPDGSVYVPMGDTTSSSEPQSGALEDVKPSMTVIALTPAGSVVRFSPRAVDGYRNVISLVRYYVSHSYVYLLAMGDKIDPGDSQKVIGRSNFIQVFKSSGDFVRTIILDSDLDDPLTLAAFPSGDILLFNLDQLNHTTRLHLLDSSGRSQSELRLFDNDFAAKLDGPGKEQSGSSAYVDKYKLVKLLSTANVIPHGDNLLLTASQADLPTLEINQHGIVHAMSLTLPAGTVTYGLLPSNDAMLHAIVGNLRSIPSSGTTSSPKEMPDGPHSFFPTEVDEFYPQDGSLARRIALESGPMPVCVINGSYTFLVPRGQDGKFQILHAKPIL